MNTSISNFNLLNLFLSIIKEWMKQRQHWTTTQIHSPSQAYLVSFVAKLYWPCVQWAKLVKDC